MEPVGFEPTVPEAASLQSARDTSFPIDSIKLVKAEGIEPSFPGSKPGTLPLCYAKIFGTPTGNRTLFTGLKGQRSTNKLQEQNWSGQGESNSTQHGLEAQRHTLCLAAFGSASEDRTLLKSFGGSSDPRSHAMFGTP